MSLLTRVVDWLRAGYPTGVPEQDYIPMLAVLGRRLTDDEVADVASELQREGMVPPSRVDIQVGITRVTDELPTRAEVERVLAHLEAHGYPGTDDEFDRLVQDLVQLPTGYAVGRLRISQQMDLEQILALYTAVGWTSYTAEPLRLGRALRRSHRVFAAWDQDKRLVGLARTISDKETICYVQDLLVLPEVQRSGVGRCLLDRVVAEYPRVRQLVLMTDSDGPGTEFYERCGFTPMQQAGSGLTGYVMLR